MKLLSNNLLETLSNAEIKKLTSQVSETLLFNYRKENQKVFTAADLWNLQRQKRNFLTRRNSF
jgi:hypothetical protein